MDFLARLRERWIARDGEGTLALSNKTPAGCSLRFE